MRPLAVLLSDLHLSLKVPRCRASESDWMEVQRRQLKEVRDYAAEYGVPVLCSGDVFHEWNAPAELIRFALDELPDQMYSIPGNHDLPYHDLKQVDRSAYGVLRTVGKIIDLPPGKSFSVNDELEVVGFPWGVPVTKAPYTGRKTCLAIAHVYVWMEGSGHAQADIKSHCSSFLDKFKTYDAVHLGDNHISWKWKNIINPGSFLRRTVNDGPPVFGVLMNDGSIRSVTMGSSAADIVDELKTEIKMEGEDFGDYLNFLRENSDTQFDFREEVQRYVDKEDVDGYTAQMIFDAMGGEK